MATDQQELISRLNSETAKIGWHELQKHYASGNVLKVVPGRDLIAVAIALHRDEASQVKAWISDGSLSPVSDQQALDWYAKKSTTLGAGYSPLCVSPRIKIEKLMR